MIMPIKSLALMCVPIPNIIMMSRGIIRFFSGYPWNVVNVAGKYNAHAVAAKITSVKEKPLNFGYPCTPIAANIIAEIKKGAAPYS